MDCPFCGKEMRAGTIPSSTRLNWRDDREDAWHEIPLSELFQSAKAFLCPDCRQIVLPVPEVEGVWEKVERKLGAASEKIEAAQKQWEAQRAQKKEETKKKNLGEKTRGSCNYEAGTGK